MRQLSNAILEAVQRGVKVRMITDDSMISTSGTQINKLQSNGKLWRREKCVSIVNALPTNLFYEVNSIYFVIKM